MPITMNRSRTQEVAFPIRRKNRASLSRSFAKTDIAWHCIGYACSEVITVQTRDLRHPKTHILFETCCSHGISWCQQSIEHLPRWYCKTCNVFVNSLLDQNYVENTHTHTWKHMISRQMNAEDECRWVQCEAGGWRSRGEQECEMSMLQEIAKNHWPPKTDALIQTMTNLVGPSAFRFDLHPNWIDTNRYNVNERRPV